MEAGGRRGQPLVAVVSLVIGYAVLRTAFWQPLIDGIPAPLQAPVRGLLQAGSQYPPVGSGPDLPALPSLAAVEPTAPKVRAKPSRHNLSAIISGSAMGPVGRARPDARLVTGHGQLWLTAMASLPMMERAMDTPERDVASMGYGGQNAPFTGAVRQVVGENRFSLDGWIFVRSGSPAMVPGGPTLASYGASQAGAVLRYRLTRATRRDPDLYVRAVAALAGSAQQDLALGASARPLADVPLRLHGEVRATHADGGTDLRPAVFATTGLASAQGEAGVSLRGYAQAGYVGGRFATAFADGQLVAEHLVARFDLGTAALGAGAWGGAQRGAARLDIGPSASVALKLGDAPARLSADYRVRVAGDASPASGAALTLSAGF